MKELLATDDFKPNSAMVVLDFLIRHSYIDPDTGLWVFAKCPVKKPAHCLSSLFVIISEPYYQDFVTGLHQIL